jgi:EpsI family protein
MNLSGLPGEIGKWYQRGDEIKFSEATEKVLRTTDYTMREYMQDNGRIANIYVGYYASQRGGATYHSPQNCLPGAGWVMEDPQYVTVVSPKGREFTVRKYVVKNGVYSEVMLYWYQGRGRIDGNEYSDKLSTVLDSVTERRSDGAMVRIMTSIWGDENGAIEEASDLAGHLVDELDPFVPR